MAEYKGEIKGFPQEVVVRMLREAEIQGRNVTIEDLEGAKSGGFDFAATKDGWVFWRDVVDGDFDLFFEKYPKATTEFKGEIEGFPKEVVEKMLERQTQKGNTGGVSAFEFNKYAGMDNGFDWEDTIEGYKFWGQVIRDENFEKFFEAYPKSSEPIEEPKEDVDKAFASVDGFIESNKEALQEMSKDSPVVFDALNDVLAELRVAYEGAEPVKKAKKKTKKVKKEPKKEEPKVKVTPAKKKPAPKVVVEEEEEIDLDSLMEDMEDMDDLMDDIDNLDCEI